MKKTILFDLDGTITDSGEGIINCATLALEHFGLPVPSREEMRVFVGEKATLSLEDFQSYLAGEGVDLWAIGTSALKKYIKAYKDDKAKEIPTGNSEEISSEKVEPETDKEPVYVDFEINGKKYHIPEEVLAEYEVK